MTDMAEKPHTSGDPAVLYLDADTEITEAIEKLKKASESEVRVVVPARSGLFQSAVNMKLINKAAKDKKKDLVLVTNDKIAKNLAGGAGIAVASSVKAMAHVPDAAAAAEKMSDEVKIDGPEPEPESSPEPPSSSGSKSDSPKSNDSGFQKKHIPLDDTPEEKPERKAKREEAPAGIPKDKKVPNYNKLNKRIWLIVGGIGAVILLILAYIFLPTGKVTVLADAKKTSLNFNFILDSAATSSDISSQTLAAQKLELAKDATYEITATGKKDIGNKATGTISVKNCDDVSTHVLSAGTGVSGGGKTFVTAQEVTIPAGTAGGGKVNCSSAVDVSIAATGLGESFNVGPTSFAINGFSSLYQATGKTSGGTSKTVTVLSAQDITAAKAQAETQTASAKDDIVKKAGSDLMVFPPTLQANLTSFNTSVPVDNEADKVTVTTKVTYSIFAANKSDVNKLFDEQLQNDVKGGKQIYQNGSADANYSVVKQLNAQKMQMNAKTTAYYGDPIDKEALAKKVAGKGKKEVSDITKQFGSQITGAQVETTPSLMPFMPLLPGKITVDIKVSTQ